MTVPTTRKIRRAIRYGLIALLVVATAAMAVLSQPANALAQAGVFCPDNGAVVVNYQGDTYTGYAVETEGMGFNSTYSFSAINSNGDVIIGTAEASIVDCVTAPAGGFVDLHSIKIQGFSSGGPTLV